MIYQSFLVKYPMEMNETVEVKVEKFFRKYEKKIFKKGEILIKESVKIPETIFYVEKGFVGQTKNRGKAEAVTLNILKKGSFFPIILALGELENQFDFKALSEVEVRMAPVKDVIKFLHENSDVLYKLTTRLSRGVGGLLNHMETLMVKEARQQILDTLTVFAKRFGEKESKYFKIKLELTHKNLAEILGLTRETVTRVLKDLIKEKKIVRKGKYFYISLPN